MMQQSAGTAVMVRLGRRQEVNEGGVAIDHRQHLRLEKGRRAADAMAQLADQFGLGRQQLRRCHHREALQERRIARDVPAHRRWRHRHREGGRRWWGGQTATEEFEDAGAMMAAQVRSS